MTRDPGFAAALAAIAGCQAWAAMKFARLLDTERPSRAPSRRVAVIVPCKGGGDALPGNVAAFLAQDHPNAQFVFVVPSPADDAWPQIEKAIGADRRSRLLASGATPARCSGKIADLLFALERLPADADILVFADADLRVRPDWLRRLVAPIEERRAEVSTTCMLYVPPTDGFWGFLRLLWMAAGAPALAALGVVAGQSFAVSRAELESLGARAAWERSLMEDLALAALARAAGRRVRFVPAAMPAAAESCEAGPYFALAVKWLSCFRVYDRRLWLAAALASGAHVWIALCAARKPGLLWAAAGLWLADGAYLASVIALLRRRLPDRFEALSPRWRRAELWAFLLAPVLWATYFAQVAVSLVEREIRWGGRVYRLRGPQDVEVIG